MWQQALCFSPGISMNMVGLRRGLRNPPWPTPCCRSPREWRREMGRCNLWDLVRIRGRSWMTSREGRPFCLITCFIEFHFVSLVLFCSCIVGKKHRMLAKKSIVNYLKFVENFHNNSSSNVKKLFYLNSTMISTKKYHAKYSCWSKASTNMAKKWKYFFLSKTEISKLYTHNLIYVYFFTDFLNIQIWEA